MCTSLSGASSPHCDLPALTGPLLSPQICIAQKMQLLPLLLMAGGSCLSLLVAVTAGGSPAHPESPGLEPTHRRQKRDWIWNQMHIDEEKNTSLPHYVGKVSLVRGVGVASTSGEQ